LNLKSTIIEEYGEKCECCGELTWQFLTIDHTGNWGGEHRKLLNKDNTNSRGGKNVYQWLKTNGFPKDKFRLLCYNCNCCTGFNGFCQHEFLNGNGKQCKCGKELNLENQFNFHKVCNIDLCKECVLGKSITRNNGKDAIKKYATLDQRRSWNKAKTLRLRLAITEKYGGACQCCGEDNYMFLTIDHKNNDGFEDKKKFKNDANKFYRYIRDSELQNDKYQILCSNCNCCKGAYGQCYHDLISKLNVPSISIEEYKGLIKHNSVALTG
jgi:hypothetical protein